MPAKVGRCTGAAGEFGVGASSESPGPGCGVTEMGVRPCTVGRLATAAGMVGAATPGEGGGLAPTGRMPGTVGRSEEGTEGIAATVGRVPTGVPFAGGAAGAAPAGGRGGWAAGGPGGRGVAAAGAAG
jgi:hypothetical protein